jgi:hypothetical protein
MPASSNAFLFEMRRLELGKMLIGHGEGSTMAPAPRMMDLAVSAPAP